MLSPPLRPVASLRHRVAIAAVVCAGGLLLVAPSSWGHGSAELLDFGASPPALPALSAGQLAAAQDANLAWACDVNSSMPENTPVDFSDLRADLVAEGAPVPDTASPHGRAAWVPEGMTDARVEETVAYGLPLDADAASVRDSIFVSVASYRDPECGATVADLFRRAAQPARVFAGVVDQRAPADAPCLDRSLCCPVAASAMSHDQRRLCAHRRNVRTMMLPHTAAKGPTFARYLAAKLYRGQAFVLLIDSHNRFVRGWDALVLGMYRTVRDEGLSTRPVLTHYPEDWATVAAPAPGGARPSPGRTLVATRKARAPDGRSVADVQGVAAVRRRSHQRPRPQAATDGPDAALATAAPLMSDPTDAASRRAWTTHLCQASFLRHAGIPKFDGVLKPVSRVPRPQPFAAAGLLFANASILIDTPFDPYLDQLFDGEEILYTVRLWTYGYDFFAPSESLLFHFYERRRAANVFGDHKGWLLPQSESMHRVRALLRLPVAAAGTSNQKDDAGRRTFVGGNSVGRMPAFVAPGPGHRALRASQRFGLGTMRDVEAYWRHARLDLAKRGPSKSWCGEP